MHLDVTQFYETGYTNLETFHSYVTIVIIHIVGSKRVANHRLLRRWTLFLIYYFIKIERSLEKM